MEMAYLLIGAVLGGGGVFAFIHFAGKNALQRARQEGEQVREQAKLEATNKAKEIELQYRQEQLKLKEQFEKANAAELKKLEEHEARLAKREDILD